MSVETNFRGALPNILDFSRVAPMILRVLFDGKKSIL